MTAKSHSRGYPIEFTGGRWIYCDTKTPIDEQRPCPRCGCLPTPEGHDACLGIIDGAVSACCGHGIHNDTILIKE